MTNIMVYKLVFCLVVHIIGAIVTTIVFLKDGTFEYASKNGDGIRFARPSDVIMQIIASWEFLVFLRFICFVEDSINDIFQKKLSQKENI